jgi:signal recognition particle receptor subunit beta
LCKHSHIVLKIFLYIEIIVLELLKDGYNMLKEMLEVKRENPQVFQVLLLDNDASQEVEVHENEQVDFLRIQEHLKQGGSVFITSKRSQKISPPKPVKKAPRKNNSNVNVTAYYFDHV